jgi:hypothetical protein
MTLDEARTLIVFPTLEWLGGVYDTSRAERMLLTIGLTESGFKTRLQVGGPARGFWQFEKNGGCAEFEASPKLADLRKRAKSLGFPFTRGETYAAIGAGADILACIMARGILWIDPAPLPTDRDEAYAYYLRRWRPGKPSKARWNTSWAAVEAML